MTDLSRSSTMQPDSERIHRVMDALREEKLDALLCAIPSHVLMLTGYWPVMGNTVALFMADGAMHLVLPEDEDEMAAELSAAKRITFKPGSLSEITNSIKAIAVPLVDVLRALGLQQARIGVELHGSLDTASYLGQFRYGSSLRDIVQNAFPHAALVPADDRLNRLAATKTPREIDCLRRSCALAKAAYEEGSASLQIGLREPQAAQLFHSAFSSALIKEHPVRADAFFFCMSGINSAKAYTAYARTRERTIQTGDLIMMHCNSNTDGYWTDITRTYTGSAPDRRQAAMQDAILEARSAALARIAPGVPAREVDEAARNVLAGQGFGKNFKHATGHGICFAAANHDAIPRIHPKSTDILETGMTFNIEPAIYIENYGGMRHCDVVAVTAGGAEVLSDFQVAASELERTHRAIAS